MKNTFFFRSGIYLLIIWLLNPTSEKIFILFFLNYVKLSFALGDTLTHPASLARNNPIPATRQHRIQIGIHLRGTE